MNGNCKYSQWHLRSGSRFLELVFRADVDSDQDRTSESKRMVTQIVVGNRLETAAVSIKFLGSFDLLQEQRIFCGSWKGRVDSKISDVHGFHSPYGGKSHTRDNRYRMFA